MSDLGRSLRRMRLLRSMKQSHRRPSRHDRRLTACYLARAYFMRGRHLTASASLWEICSRRGRGVSMAPKESGNSRYGE
jgi:hypothetical protein